MQAGSERPPGTKTLDYSTLPASVRLDETIASVDARPVPDPHAGRNLEQHEALRDD